MVRALAVLTCGAFLTLVIGVVGAGKPVLTVVLGGLYTVLATVGFAWVHRRDQRAWSVAYVAAVLALAGVVFALDPGAGSTLFLVVLVSQCVLLLPLPYTVVVILIVPMVHVGMTWWDGLRAVPGGAGGPHQRPQARRRRAHRPHVGLRGHRGLPGGPRRRRRGSRRRAGTGFGLAGAARAGRARRRAALAWRRRRPGLGAADRGAA